MGAQYVSASVAVDRFVGQISARGHFRAATTAVLVAGPALLLPRLPLDVVVLAEHVLSPALTSWCPGLLVRPVAGRRVLPQPHGRWLATTKVCALFVRPGREGAAFHRGLHAARAQAEFLGHSADPPAILAELTVLSPLADGFWFPLELAPGRPSQVFTWQQAKDVLIYAVDDRLYLYIVVSLLTGARTEELGALRWQHVHLDARTDVIPVVPPHLEVWRSVRRGGDTKTRRPRRTLALPAMCVGAEEATGAAAGRSACRGRTMGIDRIGVHDCYRDRDACGERSPGPASRVASGSWGESGGAGAAGVEAPVRLATRLFVDVSRRTS